MAQSPPSRRNPNTHGQPSGSRGFGGGGDASRYASDTDDDEEASYIEVGDQESFVAFGLVLNHWTTVGNPSDCIYCIETCTTNGVERKHMHIYYQSVVIIYYNIFLPSFTRLHTLSKLSTCIYRPITMTHPSTSPIQALSTCPSPHVHAQTAGM